MNPKLQLVGSEEGGGRFYQTSEYIAPNEHILSDTSQSTTIFKELRFAYCDYCHQSLTKTSSGQAIFWPCCSCIEVSYCSAVCAKSAYEQYHRFECGIYGLVVGEEDLYWMSHVYRHYLLFGFDVAQRAENEEVAVEYGASPPFDLNEFLSSEGKQERVMFQLILKFFFFTEQRTLPLKQQSPSGRALLCRAMASLQSNRGQRTALREHTNTVLALSMVNFFVYKGVISGDIFERPSALSQLMENLAANMMRISTNGFCWAEDLNEDNFVRVASCICLAASFLNHSCNANVTWAVGEGATISMNAIRAIQPGEALTTCYGPKEHHKFADRQERLHNDYCFYCRCEVCLKDAANFADTLKCPALAADYDEGDGGNHCGGPLVMKPFKACLKCGQEGNQLQSAVLSARLCDLVAKASEEFARIYKKLYAKKKASALARLKALFGKVQKMLTLGKSKEKDITAHRKLVLQLEPEAECSLRLQKAILGESGGPSAAVPSVDIELNPTKFNLRRMHALEKELTISSQLSYGGSYHLLEKYVALLKVYKDSGLAERCLAHLGPMVRSLEAICPSLTDASLRKLVAFLDYANFFFEAFAIAHSKDNGGIPRLMDTEGFETGDNFWSTFQAFNSKLEAILLYDIENRGDFCPLLNECLHQQKEEEALEKVTTSAGPDEQYYLHLYSECQRRSAFIEEAIAEASD